jgi:predicted RNase H-like HicB family nuclease
MDKNMFVFTGVIIKEPEGFSSLCLEVDVASQGETIEEAKNNLLEAVTLYLESAIESNLVILRPVPEDENPVKVRPNDVVETFKMNIDFEVKVYA